jgi:hypothetical protein
MRLTVVWHKPCWRAQQSPTGFAVRCCLGHPEFGGLSRQVEALSELFDATRVVALAPTIPSWLGVPPADNLDGVPLKPIHIENYRARSASVRFGPP